MAQTVVGLFNSYEQAQNVKRDLIGAGYLANDIRVFGAEQAGETTGSSNKAGTEAAATGFGATISNFFRSLSGSESDEKHYSDAVGNGGAFVAITAEDSRVEDAADILEQYGARNVQEQGTTAAAAVGGSFKDGQTFDSDGGQRLNVVEEELQVGKRQVQRGGVRVYSHVTERPVEEKITLSEEHVTINRRPVDRVATEADFAAFKEGSIELTETAEEAVVSKQARVVEEVVVGKSVSERQQTIKDTVRRTDVEVEEITPRQK